jgi:beta-glucosidase
VHGHSNVVGATIFPHNIALGMANDPDLLYEVGRATALEIRVTGLDWTFAPTIAVARNDRWGRTYESYSEDPRIVAAYAPRIVEGIQGKLGTDEFLNEDHMMATAKHFVGDGGTTGGIDQGDTAVSEATLRDQQAAGYPPAIAAGVQSVMASFNSFHGKKMHGYKEMLTDVLVGRMGFDGFVVGDWNGHGQVAGCTNTSCAASFNAGLDMFMAPNSWKGIYESLLEQVRSGEVSMQRLDEAVARILRVKIRAGVFESGRPSSRPHAGDFTLLASPRHRAIAREAVRKSLVLLKNEDHLLPLKPGMKVLLAGDGADNIGKQSGGWTLNWQGTGNLKEHFPNGESIYDGFRQAIEAGGGSVALSNDGSFGETPDVAIVVFGEDPYAEHQGDVKTVDYSSDDGLVLLRKYQQAGIPTVGVFISGRPLSVNPEINASNAFVAAWLPGTEGAGVADVLVGNEDGTARHDFEGQLSFSWPKTSQQENLNVGDENYDPQFAYGFGLSYGDDGALGLLAEESGPAEAKVTQKEQILIDGNPAGRWRVKLDDDAGSLGFEDLRGASAAGNLTMQPADGKVQDDTLLLSWDGKASFSITGPAVDLSVESASGAALELVYQVLDANVDSVTVQMGSDSSASVSLDVKDDLAKNVGAGWRKSLISLSCFADQGLRIESVTEPLIISADGALTLQLATVQIVANPGGANCQL